MDQDDLALSILVDAVLTKHRSLREAHEDDEDDDFVDFTDQQIEAMVKALWVDRYTTSRKGFEDAVSQYVSAKVADV